MILVTGGAGYIGSHVALALRDAGRPVGIIDDLSTGNRNLVPVDVPFVQADIADRDAVTAFIAAHKIDAVFHLAGSNSIDESFRQPERYAQNNTEKTKALLETCVEMSVRRFVFASSAAVYGTTDGSPLGEDSPVAPSSPYGWSKLNAERAIQSLCGSAGIDYAILRYFNVAGADPLGRSGQLAEHSGHLIKLACETALGHRPSLSVYGIDHDTPDGTCVRDFIHVADVANIHVGIVDRLAARLSARSKEGRAGFRPAAAGTGIVLNCGNGIGTSVLEVVGAVERQARRPVRVTMSARRTGDIAAVIADNDRLRQTLRWSPQHPSIDVIVRDSLAWEQKSIGAVPGSASGAA